LTRTYSNNFQRLVYGTFKTKTERISRVGMVVMQYNQYGLRKSPMCPNPRAPKTKAMNIQSLFSQANVKQVFSRFFKQTLTFPNLQLRLFCAVETHSRKNQPVFPIQPILNYLLDKSLLGIYFETSFLISHWWNQKQKNSPNQDNPNKKKSKLEIETDSSTSKRTRSSKNEDEQESTDKTAKKPKPPKKRNQRKGKKKKRHRNPQRR